MNEIHKQLDLLNEVVKRSLSLKEVQISKNLIFFIRRSLRQMDLYPDWHESEILVEAYLRTRQQTRTHPLKMQMVFDPTQSFRESLDKKMLLEYPPEEARYTGFFTSKSVPAKTDVRMSQTMRIFLNFIIEESVSWLSIAALISMFLLLLLI